MSKFRPSSRNPVVAVAAASLVARLPREPVEDGSAVPFVSERAALAPRR